MDMCNKIKRGKGKGKENQKDSYIHFLIPELIRNEEKEIKL